MANAQATDDLPQAPPRFSDRLRWLLGVMSLGLVIFCLLVYWRQFDWLAPVTMIPPWLWCVPGLLMLLASRKSLGRMLFCGIACGWLFFGWLFVEEAITILRIRNPPRKTNESRTIRVITLNCNVGKLEAAVEVAKFRPDIILLQESPGREKIRELASQIFGSDGSFVHTNDTSIVARGDVEVVHDVPGSPFVHAKVRLLNESAGQRSQSVPTSWPEMDVVSLRLSPPVFRMDPFSKKFWKAHESRRIEHRRELQGLVKHLKNNQRTKHVILGGDFNLVPKDGALDALRGFHDAFYGVGSGWCNTGTNDWPLFRVDQVWSNDQFRSTGVWARKTLNSDHRMTIADFGLER